MIVIIIHSFLQHGCFFNYQVITIHIITKINDILSGYATACDFCISKTVYRFDMNFGSEFYFLSLTHI